MSSSESQEMALFNYFLRDTSAPKQSSSLAQKEKDLASNFVSKAEKEAQRMGVTLGTQSKRSI